MSDSSVQAAEYAQELDVVGLLNALASGWRSVMCATVIGVSLAVVYLHLASYLYTAELKVTAVSRSGDPLGGQIGALGGLASLAGIKVNIGQSGSFDLYVEGLRSRQAADQLSKNNIIMRTIFKDGWDARSNSWAKPSPTLTQRVKLTIRRLLGLPTYEWHPPGGAELHEYLNDALVVDEENDSPVVSVRYHHEDPSFAVLLLSELNSAVDSNLRAKALERANEQIRFLTEKLSTVSVAEHRLAIAQALSEQEKIRIMASSTLPFSADIFDGPSSSPFPTKPRPIMVLLLGAFMGIFGATALIAARYVWNSERLKQA